MNLRNKRMLSTSGETFKTGKKKGSKNCPF